MKKAELALYRDLVGDIKSRVRDAQHRAALSANAEMIRLYWDIGRLIAARKRDENWGTGVISRLATDLKNELPGVKGFSERNLQLMVQFFAAYSPEVIAGQQLAADSSRSALDLGSKEFSIAQRPVAQLNQAGGLEHSPDLEPAADKLGS